MESAKRVLVYLSKERSLLQCAKFVQSITGYYSGGQQNKVYVHCGLEQNQFIISDQQFSNSISVQLKSPAFCPIRNISSSQAASLPQEVRNRGVDVGVAVLLQSVNQKVLLTRRTKNLSIFPNVWVPPGGHIESGEQLLEAGLRELQEETGLQIHTESISWSMLGLWESAFPPLLSQGLPSRHHIVVYLLVLSNETHQELQEKMSPEEQEVSACVWLDPYLAEHIVATEDGEEDSGKDMSDLPATISITEVKAGSLTQVDSTVETFLNRAPSDGADIERVSTGTKYSLRLWLYTLSKQR
ncbi:nucleoside diphosphate-linked moiety X motif 17 isoform X1 [Pelobates cultripes]|uniref:m7GpppN-mRNA hydrolase NUDT17 n=1 Tax=Pelobates cultripes TaxID=61616 RepID=A0AAD1WSR5_PELCU|nr:nucleoside diphosphate-linked moiety X motif 17 isoform X1 [Pelobates cultripes]